MRRELAIGCVLLGSASLGLLAWLYRGASLRADCTATIRRVWLEASAHPNPPARGSSDEPWLPGTRSLRCPASGRPFALRARLGRVTVACADPARHLSAAGEPCTYDGNLWSAGGRPVRLTHERDLFLYALAIATLLACTAFAGGATRLPPLSAGACGAAAALLTGALLGRWLPALVAAILVAAAAALVRHRQAKSPSPPAGP